MNILVVNGYVRQNKGDGALMSVLCHELQKSFPGATVKVSSQENPKEYPTFENWQTVGSFNRYCFDPATGKISHLFRLLLSTVVITLLPFVPRRLRKRSLFLLPRALRLSLSALIEADLVVAMGGGYLNGNRSLMANIAVYLMLAPLELAKRFGACAVCAPQSMGPFATKFQKRIVIRTLEKIDKILTREKKTTQLLSELSGHFPLSQSVDSCFLFTSNDTANLRAQLHEPAGKLLVGITVRHWLNPKLQHNYEQAIAKTIDHLVARRNATVVLIPQVTSLLGGDDDRITAGSVYEMVKHTKHVHVLTEDYDHHSIKSLYNALDIIIGTRFHSVIFSLTSHVPALAIEYEHKTSGIMHDLGLDEWVVRIEEATPEVLIKKADELIDSRVGYKKHLKGTLPAYIDKAREATTLIKQTYEASLEPDQDLSPSPSLNSQS